MSYKDTFIQVAADCPVTHSVVPLAKGDKKPVHVLQYELLSQHPYTFTHEDLIFEVYVRQHALSTDEIQMCAAEIRDTLFQNGQPCLRASLLTKKYGWGAHYDHDGKIALYGVESEEYRRFTRPAAPAPKLLMAMRNKRA